MNDVGRLLDSLLALFRSNSTTPSKEIAPASVVQEPLASSTFTADEPTMPKLLTAQPSRTPAKRDQISNVCMLDVDAGSVRAVEALGFSIFSGTFGRAYRVPRSAGLYPVPLSGDVPRNLTECDIVVIDLVNCMHASEDLLAQKAPPGVESVFQSAESGVIGSAPVYMELAEEKITQILQHGGVLIVLCAPIAVDGYIQGKTYSHGGLQRDAHQLSLSAWPFWDMPGLRRFQVTSDHGTAIRAAADAGKGVGDQLLRACADLHFECTFDLEAQILRYGDHQTQQAVITPLLVNKFGKTVGFMLEPESGGLVVALPQTSVGEKPALFRHLFATLLPELVPSLFLSAESWVGRDAYVLPEVVSLRREIEAVRSAADEAIAALMENVASTLAASEYLTDLLTETDKRLVDAVLRMLHADFDFVDAVDVDEQEDFVSTEGHREDIWIRDRSSVLLAEVKGIAGAMPTESDALQVQKYIAPRMKLWKRTDIAGLFIVNHQRGVPPLERLTDVFQPDVLENGRKHDVGFVTTWDLFRLARGRRRWGWPAVWIQDLLYLPGRVPCIPTGYRMLGVVERVWSKVSALSIEQLQHELRVGMTVALVTNLDFIQWKVESIQLDGATAESAAPPSVPGIPYPTNAEPTVGAVLYIVSAP